MASVKMRKKGNYAVFGGVGRVGAAAARWVISLRGAQEREESKGAMLARNVKQLVARSSALRSSIHSSSVVQSAGIVQVRNS